MKITFNAPGYPTQAILIPGEHPPIPEILSQILVPGLMALGYSDGELAPLTITPPPVEYYMGCFGELVYRIVPGSDWADCRLLHAPDGWDPSSHTPEAVRTKFQRLETNPFND